MLSLVYSGTKEEGAKTSVSPIKLKLPRNEMRLFVFVFFLNPVLTMWAHDTGAGLRCTARCRSAARVGTLADCTRVSAGARMWP